MCTVETLQCFEGGEKSEGDEEGSKEQKEKRREYIEGRERTMTEEEVISYYLCWELLTWRHFLDDKSEAVILWISDIVGEVDVAEIRTVLQYLYIFQKYEKRKGERDGNY